MIEIQDLTMRYKNGKGVGDINITVDNGEVKGLLGPNGAGKSTTMRSLMGFLIPSQGTLSVEGVDTIENPVEAKKIIGYLPGDPQLPQNLNSKSLFKLGADMRAQSTDYAIELAEKFELEVNQTIKEFANNGAAILLSSHIISEVEKVADSMAVLRDGAKVYDETYETFSSKAAEQGEDLEDAFFKFYDRRDG